jgi:hypothetical protein
VKALLSAGTPVDAKEVRGFLGLAIYCASHIPELAILAAPLWELTHEGVKFEWTIRHETALSSIKKALITESLSYFKKSWATELTVDASPVGLAAVLAQVDPEDPKSHDIVTYISRKLTDIESRMAHVEKEGLSVVWACERLYLYLLGKRFTLITDNRAIELIYMNPQSDPPLRIKRWALRLMRFDFNIIHRPGIYNIADYMSRHPMDDPDEIVDDTEEYVSFIAEYATPKAFARDQLIFETNNDLALCTLRKLIAGERQTDPELIELIKPFNRVLDTLTVTSQGLVLKGSRLILPKALQLQAIDIAHGGHQGLTRTKALLRTKVWFPAMDTKVEEIIAACFPCQLEDTSPTQQPILSTPMAEAPMEYTAMDYLGPLPNKKELMVLMDEYSHFPFACMVPTTAAEYTLPKLNELFSMFGIPIELKSDNGPPFNGHQFAEFANYYGFHHRKVAPENAPANGLIEGFMKPLAKVIRTAQVENRDWSEAIQEFLRNYRSTPHPTTGISPSEMMFGKNRTNRLPAIVDDSKSREEYKRIATTNDILSKVSQPYH